ncbi:MAG TPA: acyloxyacyl hydrolase [Gemmatimonadaceae bacterium]|nr:acyloxyacyl hydrolase [Gemmatimonadaceae bacterium]
MITDALARDARGRTPCVPAALLLLVSATAGSPLAARAQETPPTLSAPTVTVGGWVAAGRNSRRWPFGSSPGNDLTLTAVRLTRAVAGSQRWTLDYTMDLVPVAWVSMPRDTVVVDLWSCRTMHFCEVRVPADGRREASGRGVEPLGLQLRFRRWSRVQPLVHLSGGALWFDDEVPRTGTARFNFIGRLGAGVSAASTGGLAVTVGYTLAHISNGGTKPLNPGIDSQMLYVGLTRVPISQPEGRAAPRSGLRR